MIDLNNINSVTEFILNLFTTQQQAALGIITLCIMVATQQFKVIYFGFKPERRDAVKRAKIHLFALVAGGIAGIAGHFIGVPPQPLWFWVVSGVISGGTAIGAFKILVEVVWLKWIKREQKPQ